MKSDSNQFTTIGLGPFPISAYGIPDVDDRLVGDAVDTYRGGYSLELEGTQPAQGRETRPTLINTHESGSMEPRVSEDDMIGFTYQNEEFGK